MRTKIVYCVVSDDKDYYLEEAIVSAYSVKYHNPDVIIELVVDQSTSETIIGTRELINNYVNEIIVISVPNCYNKTQRSRFLKTNLRKYIKGDYLFIDTDTIICNKLNEIDEITWDICAVRDMNKHSYISDVPIKVLQKYSDIKKDIYREPYYNSGVMYVKDTNISYQLYEEWHKKWCIYTSKGLNKDQPPLCYANKKMGNCIHEIDTKWNCQLFFNGIHYLDKALILHYYNSENRQLFACSKDSTLSTIRELGFIPSIITDYIIHPQDSFLVTSSGFRFVYKQSHVVSFYSRHRILFTPIEFIFRVLLRPFAFVKNINKELKRILKR